MSPRDTSVFIDLVIDVSVFEDADHIEHHFPPKPASGTGTPDQKCAQGLSRPQP